VRGKEHHNRLTKEEDRLLADVINPSSNGPIVALLSLRDSERPLRRFSDELPFGDAEQRIIKTIIKHLCQELGITLQRYN
jgi:hypothetical protein